MATKTSRSCDKCQSKIESEDTRYRAEFTRPSEKGVITKTQKLDICHKCFKDFTDGGWNPKWTTLTLNKSSGKWEES